MAEKSNPDAGGIRVNSVDGRGRPISPLVQHAAEMIARRALLHAEKLSIDPAVAENLLEEAAATVTRAISANPAPGKGVIRDLQSYLFRAFIRRVNKKRKRELSLSDLLKANATDVPNGTDPRSSIENKILIDELLTCCDATTRDMLLRRMAGFSWKEIGSAYGISRHAAESRVNQAFQKARKSLGLR